MDHFVHLILYGLKNEQKKERKKTLKLVLITEVKCYHMMMIAIKNQKNSSHYCLRFSIKSTMIEAFAMKCRLLG